MQTPFSQTFQEPLEIQTSATPSCSIIWLHGLGANGHDFEAIVPELTLPESLGVRFIFPHAPTMRVTINGGISMPAWYDIISVDLDRKVDTDQLLNSARFVHQLINKEIERGIPAEKIVLAGFSQGGAVVYEAGLSFDKPLAGVMALSTYLATAASVERHPSNSNLPFFIAHGEQDDIVSESLGQDAKNILGQWGYQNEYHRYPMAHSVCLEEINDISAWLVSVLSKES